MAEELKKSYFEVLGMCCASEVVLIEKILKQLNGVQEISVILATKTVVVHHTSVISDIAIVEALNKVRLEATVRPQEQTNFQNKWPAPTTMFSGLLLALSFLKYVYHPLEWLALGAVAVGLPTLILRSIASIRNLTLNINILVLMAVIGTVALRDFWEAGTVVFLFSIAQWLETRASYKAMATMSSLMNMAPQKAIIAETGEQVDVSAVEMNTVLAVKVGDVIPIDGIVVEGKCEVDEKMLTGESFPVTKELDSTVWAGTINLNGYISVKTTALAKDSFVSRMTKLVEESHNKKSRAQRFVDNCAKYYIPVVMLIAVALAVIPAALRLPNKDHWFHLAIVVLVSTCPCALILSTPVVIFCALSKAATTGLLVKGGDYLEILAKVKTVAFDKTGTITRGEFVVTNFQVISDDVSLNALLYWVSSIESKSSHPMAAALVEYGRLHSIEPKPENVEDFQNFPGEGVSGKIERKDIYIGNRRIRLRAGCAAEIEFQNMEGKTNGYIYCGTTLVGTFSLSDTCRSGAMEAVKEIKSLGIKCVMLTGDNHAAAMLAQDQLGHALDVVHAELLPEDKAQVIEEYKKEGPTVMIGDGINDAPALATADIGISMGISGSALAMETGHVILMSNNIQKIPFAIKLARRAFRKLIENVIISITTKGAILALAFAGHPLIWASVVADVGTCLVVILNSMLLLQETPKLQGKSMNTVDGDYGDSVAIKCNDGCCEKLIREAESPSGKGCSNCTEASCKDKKFANIAQSSSSSSSACCLKKCEGQSQSKKCGTAHGATINNACGCSTVGLPESIVNNASKISDNNDGCCEKLIREAESPSVTGCSNCTEASCKDKKFANIAQSSCSSSSACCLQKCEAQSQRKKCGTAQGATINNASGCSTVGLPESIVNNASKISDNNDGCREKLIREAESPSVTGCSNCTEAGCKDKKFANIAQSGSSSSSSACCLQKCEAQSLSKKCGTAQGATIDNASKISDNREIRGCCKQFAEQCCGKPEQYTTNRLSEIVIE